MIAAFHSFLVPNISIWLKWTWEKVFNKRYEITFFIFTGCSTWFAVLLVFSDELWAHTETQWAETVMKSYFNLNGPTILWVFPPFFQRWLWKVLAIVKTVGHLFKFDFRKAVIPIFGNSYGDQSAVFVGAGLRSAPSHVLRQYRSKFHLRKESPPFFYSRP